MADFLRGRANSFTFAQNSWRPAEGMKDAAKNLDFERAAEIRDEVRALNEARISV